jgi:multiple antibiotic resistance protein
VIRAQDVSLLKDYLQTTTLVMLGVLAIWYVLLLASGTINRVLGETGTNVISRIMGLILAALSIETILIGIRTAFALG